MLDLFTREMSKLMYLCEKSPEKNTEFFLDLIKPTLISRDAGTQHFMKMWPRKGQSYLKPSSTKVSGITARTLSIRFSANRMLVSIFSIWG